MGVPSALSAAVAAIKPADGDVFSVIAWGGFDAPPRSCRQRLEEAARERLEAGGFDEDTARMKAREFAIAAWRTSMGHAYEVTEEHVEASLRERGEIGALASAADVALAVRLELAAIGIRDVDRSWLSVLTTFTQIMPIKRENA